jgi:hypothetical protein
MWLWLWLELRQTVINIWSWAPDGGSTPKLTDWLTDRQSQCDFDFDFEQFSFLSDGDKVESPGVFSSWEYKDETGAWIVKINWDRIGTRSTEEYKRSSCEECKAWLEDFICNIFSDLKWQFLCWDPLLGDDLWKTENYSVCETVNWKVCKSEMALYFMYLSVIKRVCVTKVLTNPIIWTRTRHFVMLTILHVTVIFSESCSESSQPLRRGVRAGA